MSEWPSFALLPRPPNFELEAVDEDAEVENARLELMLEGTVVTRAPTVASPWVLFSCDVAVAATIAVVLLVVVIGVVGIADNRDKEENGVVVASMLLSPQPPPSPSTAVLAPMVSLPRVPLPTALQKSSFRVPPQLDGRAGMPA